MDKSPDAFRTITEVAEDLSVPQHVLRFWETRFANIKPLKRGGGRRYYRPDDVDLLRGIRHLLYGEGYTIKGVQRLLKEKGPRFVQGIRRGDERAPIRSAADGEEGAGERDEAAEEVASAAQPRPGRQISSDRRRDASTGELGNRGASLAQDDIDRLRSALDELLECERVLTTLRGRDDPGGSDEAAA